MRGWLDFLAGIPVPTVFKEIVTFLKNVSFSNGISVTGNATISGDMQSNTAHVTGAVTAGSAAISGNTTTGTLTVTSNATVGGTLGVTGTTTAAAINATAISGSSLASSSTISANSTVSSGANMQTSGASSGYFMIDRAGTGTNWGWYPSNPYIYLWHSVNGAIWSVDAAGQIVNMPAMSGINPGASVSIGLGGFTTAGSCILFPCASMIYVALRCAFSAGYPAATAFAQLANSAHWPSAIVTFNARKIAGPTPVSMYLNASGQFVCDGAIANGDSYEADFVYRR